MAITEHATDTMAVGGQSHDVRHLVTVELRPQDGGTELVLTHRMLTEEKQREDHRHGWTSCLERLGAIL